MSRVDNKFEGKVECLEMSLKMRPSKKNNPKTKQKQWHWNKNCVIFFIFAHEKWS